MYSIMTLTRTVFLLEFFINLDDMDLMKQIKLKQLFKHYKM